LFEKCQHAQSAGILTAGRRNFSLKSVRIPAKKLLASGPKSLAAGHIANFQISPSQYPFYIPAADLDKKVCLLRNEEAPSGKDGASLKLFGDFCGGG